MGSVPAPMPVPPSPTSLVVTLSGLAPGAPLDTAVRLADALDARRVPLTLLAGARPHPDVVAWARARRRAGDAVLLLGASDRPWPRLPHHEAGLRLAAALRVCDAVGLDVDGFAAPGWAVSTGVRTALVASGVDLLVDDAGVHRLGDDGAPGASTSGPVTIARDRLPRRRRGPRPGLRRAAGALRHRAGTTDPTTVGALLDAVDDDLAAGAVPCPAPALVVARRPVRSPRDLGDPELWSITA